MAEEQDKQFSRSAGRTSKAIDRITNKLEALKQTSETVDSIVVDDTANTIIVESIRVDNTANVAEHNLNNGNITLYRPGFTTSLF